MARLAGKRERRYSPSSASTGLVDELVEEVLEEESAPLEEVSSGARGRRGSGRGIAGGICARGSAAQLVVFFQSDLHNLRVISGDKGGLPIVLDLIPAVLGVLQHQRQALAVFLPGPKFHRL